MRHRLLVLAVLAGAFFGATGARGQAPCAQGATVKAWECWEGTLAVTAPGVNLYRDARVRIDFTAGALKRTTYAFWNGESNLLRFRMAFPTVADWSWTPTCEACVGVTLATPVPNLRKVGVTAATLTGADLFSRGYPVVETTGPNRRQAFKFPDVPALTPPQKSLFWLGDTAWPGPTLATDAEWTSYLADRKGKGFTVVQVALPVDWMADRSDLPADTKACFVPRQPKAKRNGAVPFTVTAACPLTIPFPKSCSLWNAAYWDEFDRRVQQANAQGFLVVIVGLMEGVLEGELFNTDKCRFCPPPIEVSKVYARNVAARLAGFHVVLSPGFDRFNGSNKCPADTLSVSERIKQVGAVIKETTPHLLVTNHWASYAQVGDMTALQSETWLDFQLFQSGQAGQESNSDAQRKLLLFRARDLATQLRAVTPKKPAVNGEALYAGSCSSKPALGRTHYTDANVRQTAYWAWLAGATGYTYGAQGLYDWGGDKNRECAGQLMGFDPTSGAAQPSSKHMRLLKTILGTVDVSRLGPDPGRVSNSPVSPNTEILEHQRGLGAIVPGTGGAITQVVAYLPAAASSLTVYVDDLTNFSCWTKQWLDPRNGTAARTAVPTASSEAGRRKFTTPQAGVDWVLVLKSATCPAAASRTQVWVGLAGSEGSERTAIFARTVDAANGFPSKAYEISASTDLAEKSAPRLEVDEAGNQLVVWKELDTEGQPGGLLVRALDPDGLPMAEPASLASAGVDLAADVAVVATGVGGYAVAWEGFDFLTGEETLEVRWVDSEGTPGVSAVLHRGTEPSEQPWLASDGAGGLVALWNQTYDKEGNLHGVARRFAATGELQGEEFSVASALVEGTSQAVAGATLDAQGGLAVVFDQFDAGGTRTGIFEQSFELEGLPAGDPLTVWVPDGSV